MENTGINISEGLTDSVADSFSFRLVFALRPSKQFFSHVGTDPPLPGYHQYCLGGKCILLKDTTRGC